MFLGIVLTIWIGLHVYVFWRAATVPFIARHVGSGTLVGVAVLLGFLFPASLAFVNSRVASIARVFAIVGADWVGVLFLLFVTMLAADVITGLGFLFRDAAPTVRGCALVTAGILAIIALVQGSRAPVVQSYEVTIPNLAVENDGTLVVVASDLHLGPLNDGPWLAARVEQINAQHPDLVILAGDIIEGNGDSKFVPILRRLAAPMGVWAVNGNHETYRRVDPAMVGRPSLVEQAGIHLLRDHWAQVRPGFIISGVDDLTSRRRQNQSYGEFVDRALVGRPRGATLFVSHTPWLADRAAQDGASLMISGHTHNGQIWPFTYVVRLTYPLIAGRYDVNGMPVIVCRGTGTWGPRMRLWQRGEILRIILRAPRTSA